MKLPESAEKGFTLIEVISAMTILSIGILGTTALIPSALYLTQVTQEYDTAKSAAANKMEDIGACDFNQVVTRYHNTYFTVAGLNAPVAQPNPGYISVNNTNPNLLDITVIITWQGALDPNATLNFSMKTMRAND
ncbi:MAG: prepilin-type N-terminal cleavage/methylation domain-containing protein [Planctomycetes bacterium]|nr:prepilin-type N-terminal cleavage/methylation domain-containing protein [Planctomycetota bacterium]